MLPLAEGSLAPPPGLRHASSGAAGTGSPQRSPSGLARTGSLKRELGIPQLEAAQSLRRAMSCYPELSGGSEGQGGGEGQGAGGAGQG